MAKAQNGGRVFQSGRIRTVGAALRRDCLEAVSWDRGVKPLPLPFPWGTGMSPLRYLNPCPFAPLCILCFLWLFPPLSASLLRPYCSSTSLHYPLFTLHRAPAPSVSSVVNSSPSWRSLRASAFMDYGVTSGESQIIQLSVVSD